MKAMYYDSRVKFESRSTATDALKMLHEIADKYGYASVVDLHDLADVTSNYLDNARGWNAEDLDQAEITRICDGYTIKFPSTTPIAMLIHKSPKPKISYREYSAAKKPTTTPEPISITIHTKDVDDIDTTLAEIFNYISTIKDRMINLTIM